MGGGFAEVEERGQQCKGGGGHIEAGEEHIVQQGYGANV